jgi:hypothetical protein
MPSFKIDVSTAVVFVATPPTPKLVSKQTGEIAMDRETGAPLATVGLLISDEGGGEPLPGDRAEHRCAGGPGAWDAGLGDRAQGP